MANILDFYICLFQCLANGEDIAADGEVAVAGAEAVGVEEDGVDVGAVDAGEEDIMVDGNE